MLYIVKRTAQNGSIKILDEDSETFIPISKLTDEDGDFGNVEFDEARAKSIIDPMVSHWAKADLDAGFTYELVPSDDDFWAPEGTPTGTGS